MNPALTFLAALLLAIALTPAPAPAPAPRSATEPPPRLPDGCIAELVFMWTCLPHVQAATSNYSAPSPSAHCCDAFLFELEVEVAGGDCLCHLVRYPYVLGIPLNATRLLSLVSSCGGWTTSVFNETCRGPEPVPELPFFVSPESLPHFPRLPDLLSPYRGGRSLLFVRVLFCLLAILLLAI